MHWKEKEYIVQGEYLNGKRWNGYGYFNGEEEKKCEIKNGKGTAIECHHYGFWYDILIECEYKNGEKTKGKEEYYLCSLFPGAYIVFEGEYLNGKKWNGIFIKDYSSNNSELKDGKRFGIEINYDNSYEGEFINGEKNGKGEEYYFWKNKLSEGEYSNGKRNGKGKEYYKNGNLKFEGEYKEGKRWKGNGEEYDDNGALIFKDEYKEGKRWNGKGEEYDSDGYLIFKGKYKEGKRWNGKGEEYDSDGYLLFEGEYKEGGKIEDKFVRNKLYLIKRSKQKIKRIQLNDKYEEI